jgi:holliday junction DNA helicase RuvA
MIAHISGRIINFLDNKAIVRTTSGIGYLVTYNPQKRYMINENVEMYTLHVIRESTQELFGFENIDDLQWSQNLMKVNGVGPKMATLIVYSMGVNGIKDALENKSIDAFSAVKGLGKKTAQKIVLELKGAMIDIEKIVSNTDNGDFAVNFTEVMANLGYKRGDVVRIISTLKKEDLWDTEDLLTTIRNGLSFLGK